MVVNPNISNTGSKKKNNFFRDVQSELKKITWTTKQELVACTKIVLGATVVFSFVIYAADLFVRNALSLINLIFRWIA
ncbi:MAG: preprotein translocase subunit SecE [Parachlamydiales bacterium]|jgi:preprotein translocase subunit SecE